MAAFRFTIKNYNIIPLKNERKKKLKQSNNAKIRSSDPSFEENWKMSGRKQDQCYCKRVLYARDCIFKSQRNFLEAKKPLPRKSFLSCLEFFVANQSFIPMTHLFRRSKKATRSQYKRWFFRRESVEGFPKVQRNAKRRARSAYSVYIRYLRICFFIITWSLQSIMMIKCFE